VTHFAAEADKLWHRSRQIADARKVRSTSRAGAFIAGACREIYDR
jgi:hypothetical protein